MGAPEQCNDCGAKSFTVEGLVDGLIKYRCDKCGQPVLESGQPDLYRCANTHCENWISEGLYCPKCRERTVIR